MRLLDKRLMWWLPALLVMVMIFGLSQMDAEASSSLSGGMLDRLLKGLEHLGILPWKLSDPTLEKLSFLIRKLAHFTEYALLGASFVLPFAFHLQKRGRSLILSAISCAAAYASLDEFHQLFISGRSGQLRDVCLDTAGACMGVFLLYWLLRRRFFSQE